MLPKNLSVSQYNTILDVLGEYYNAEAVRCQRAARTKQNGEVGALKYTQYHLHVLSGHVSRKKGQELPNE